VPCPKDQVADEASSSCILCPTNSHTQAEGYGVYQPLLPPLYGCTIDPEHYVDQETLQIFPCPEGTTTFGRSSTSPAYCEPLNSSVGSFTCEAGYVPHGGCTECNRR